MAVSFAWVDAPQAKAERRAFFDIVVVGMAPALHGAGQVAAGVFPAPGRRAYRTLNMNAPSPLPAAPEHFTLADSPDVWSWNSHKFVELYRVARDGSVPNPRNPGTRAPADSLAATRRGCPNLLDG